MKNRKERNRSQAVTARKPDKECGFEESVKGLAPPQQLPDEFVKMFSKLGSGTVEDDCSGNCITCKKKAGCETYKKIRNCFTG